MKTEHHGLAQKVAHSVGIAWSGHRSPREAHGLLVSIPARCSAPHAPVQDRVLLCFAQVKTNGSTKKL